MDVGSLLVEPPNRKWVDHQEWTMCAHMFSDSTHITPAIFLYLLKGCYVNGTLSAVKKYNFLRQQAFSVFQNGPDPGASIFVVQCLYVLSIFEPYREGFSHLILQSLRRVLKQASDPPDSSDAKVLAAQLFYDIANGFVNLDIGIVVKILETFNVQLSDIEKIICQLKANNNCRFDSAESFVEQYISNLINSQCFGTAVSLLERFSIRQWRKSFLLKMMIENDFKAAEKWATFMGKSMLCKLVQEYMDRNMMENAYQTIKKNNLQQEFPQVYHKCQENSLKKLAEKGCWDVAERKASNNRELIEYIVYLAMEAGYTEKVDELCERYSLQGFVKATELEASLVRSHYLQFKDLQMEEIMWVDKVDCLYDTTSQIERCKFVGIDCEWKPNYLKGSKSNKVSIMQIATDRMVFILDLITLYTDAPTILDNCLSRILQSPRILKLGYNFQCDIKQLACSYVDLECFRRYEMLLDVQNLFTEQRGGLAGLAKKILGVGLNKTRRNSNWEQRPLSENQLEYAALDAAVLHHIFSYVCTHPQHNNIEWKSKILSHKDIPKKSKNELRKEAKAVKGDAQQSC